MSQRRKQNSRRPGPSGIPGARIIRNPAKPLKPLLDVLTDIALSVDKAVSSAEPRRVGYDSFDQTILIRGVNLLKATVALSEDLHWEVASSCARQLFELVVNMDSLRAMPDREEASMQYAAFGLLQKVRAQIVEYDYGRTTGRQVDEEHAAGLAAMLDSPGLAQFRGKPRKDGTPTWKSSWNGLNTWEMAKQSANDLRVSQYNQLFVSWSEETHAAPGALVGSMFRELRPGAFEAFLTNDLRETAQVASMAMFLFCELWMSLKNVPPVNHEDWQDWLLRTQEYIAVNYNVPEFKTFV